MQLAAGATAQIELTVTEDDTALALGSGDLPVLGTPRLVALVEEATVAAVGPALAENQSSVGTKVELEHLAPSGVGGRIVAQATLISVEGRRLVFDVSAQDADTIVACGRVERAVIDRERFMAKLDPARIVP